MEEKGEEPEEDVGHQEEAAAVQSSSDGAAEVVSPEYCNTLSWKQVTAGPHTYTRARTHLVLSGSSPLLFVLFSTCVWKPLGGWV